MYPLLGILILVVLLAIQILGLVKIARFSLLLAAMLSLGLTMAFFLNLISLEECKCFTKFIFVRELTKKYFEIFGHFVPILLGLLVIASFIKLKSEYSYAPISIVVSTVFTLIIGYIGGWLLTYINDGIISCYICPMISDEFRGFQEANSCFKYELYIGVFKKFETALNIIQSGN